MQAYREGILMGGQQQSATEIADDYLDTVECNSAWKTPATTLSISGIG